MQYVRDDMEVSPQFRREFDEQYAALVASGDIVTREIMRNDSMTPVEFFRKGAVVEHPNAWREVQQGTAIPADMNCAVRCKMDGDTLKEKQLHYELLIRHMEPGDEDLLANEIVEGVDPATGDYIPGKNWHRLSEFRAVAKGPLADDEEDDELE
jgi:hypothetical protein